MNDHCTLPESSEEQSYAFPRKEARQHQSKHTEQIESPREPQSFSSAPQISLEGAGISIATLLTLRWVLREMRKLVESIRSDRSS